MATSSKAFASDIAVKSRDAINLHQERHNANSVISHNVVASDYRMDFHQAVFLKREYFFLRNSRLMASIHFFKYFK